MTDSCVHKLVADVAVIAQDRVLLVRYKDENKYDHQRGWFLPDDLLVQFEHPDDAARRILNAQLNVYDDRVQLSHIESFKGQDRTWHLAFHYKLQLDSLPELEPLEAIEACEWFPLKQLPERSAVAHHGWALDVISTMV